MNLSNSFFYQFLEPSLLDNDTKIRFEELNGRITPNKSKKVIFAFHGYGSSAYGLLPLIENILHDNITYIIPNGITECEGNETISAPKKEGRQWFSIKDMSTSYLLPSINKASKTLIHFINNQLQRLNLEHKDAILFGFSQGAMLASNIGLNMLSELGGIIACSGCVLPTNPEHIIPKKNLFTIIHGKNDNVLPFEMAQLSTQELRNSGIDVDHYFLDNLGHQINNTVIEIINKKIKEYFNI